MAGRKHVLVVSGLVSGLTQVSSVRQKATTEKDGVFQVMETVSNLMQEHMAGSGKIMEQITSVVTPGAGDAYSSSLGAVLKTIESDIEPKIKQQQEEARGKLDSSFSSLSEAGSAAVAAKSAADAADRSWFECAAEEQAKRQTIEAASKSLASSRSNENEACQLQQDNKDFNFDAAGKYMFEVKCDFAVGDCASKMEAFVTNTLKKIEEDAKALLNSEQAKYTKLKASCDARKEERVAAQSALDAADSAWSSQRATCVKLSAQRKSAMCTFGSKVEGKCTAESQFRELVAATQTSDGTALSEIDRASEWKVSQTAKCLVSKAVSNGLQTSVSAADTEACVSSIPTFESGVGGKLNLHSDEFAKLEASNKCTPMEITFFNGQAWTVPEGEAPASTEYTRGAFTPELAPSDNFDFCSAAGPAPAPAPAPDAGCLTAVAATDMSGAAGFRITAVIQTVKAAGTIFAKAFEHGLWKNGHKAGQGKMLFLRGGKVCFDIGWVGVITGTTNVNDGEPHEVGVEFDVGKYWVLVDGKREASGLRPVRDNPATQFSVGKSIGHKVTDGVANGDMAPAFEGSITGLSNGNCGEASP